MTPFATITDLESRYPAELIVLAADEQTGVQDDARVELAVEDASSEVRGILKGRYSVTDLGRLDADSLSMLKIYAMDIALYRIALAFARSNERIEARYKAATARLEAIARGHGGLSFVAAEGADPTDTQGSAPLSPGEVLIEAPERLFTRDRARGL